MAHDVETQRLFWVWWEFKERCTDPKNVGFKNYGGRGIRVCERWMTFRNFLQDMAPRPFGKLLDRIDNDGNYEPGNCRWATRKEQNSNRRWCTYVLINGDKVTLKEACRIIGITYSGTRNRIRRGWSVVEALCVPSGRERRNA